MTRYKITFTDGSEMGICLNYLPKVGDSMPGFLLPRIIATVTEVV